MEVSCDRHEYRYIEQAAMYSRQLEILHNIEQAAVYSRQLEILHSIDLEISSNISWNTAGNNDLALTLFFLYR